MGSQEVHSGGNCRQQKKKNAWIYGTPQSAPQELISQGFKIYNNRDEATHQQYISDLWLLASTTSDGSKGAKRGTAQPRTLFQVSAVWPLGHRMSQPRTPSKPCPIHEGPHWKMDCLSTAGHATGPLPRVPHHTFPSCSV